MRRTSPSVLYPTGPRGFEPRIGHVGEGVALAVTGLLLKVPIYGLLHLEAFDGIRFLNKMAVSMLRCRLPGWFEGEKDS